MAKHEVVIHENTGATKALAPYLGNYIAKETIREASFINEIAQLCGLSTVQLQAILDGSFEALEELEKSELVRIHTDIGVICAVITGSFPTADAAFDKEKNTLELALRLDDSIKLTLTDVVPSIVADESLTKLRVDNVMDLATPRPMNLIHGQHVFRVAGFNMELTDEGATAYLLNGLGVTFPLVIDEVITKQLFKAHTAALLPAGDYKLVVKSRAGDAGGPLQTAFRRVKYLEVVDPPTLTSAHAPDGDPGTLLRSAKAVLEGTGLDGAAVDIVYTGASGQMTKRALESDFESATGEKIVLKTSVWDDIEVESADMTVKVTTATGTASLDVTFVA